MSESQPTPYERLRAFAPWLSIVAAYLVIHASSIVNAKGTHSDAAIVGLQAAHFLRGEWSLFLWGSGYQTSVDSVVAALFFLPFGANAFSLRLSTLLGHLLLTYFAYSTLKQNLSAWTAALLCSPLVLTTAPLHTYILYPPRQASLTVAVFAVYLLHRYASKWAVFAGTFAAGIACFADPYALVFLPPICIFALFVSYASGTDTRSRLNRVLTGVAGAAIGLLPYLALRYSPHASLGKTSLSLELIPRNATLLWNDCLPDLLGTKVYGPKVACDWVAWNFSSPIRLIQTLGAVLFLGLILSGGLLILSRKLPIQVRGLGFSFFLALPVTLAGFLLSVMAFDSYSSRYLVSIVLFAPFAMAPVATLIPKRALAALLAPYAIAASISCWIGQSPPGILPHPMLKADDSVVRLLDSKGIQFAQADYWVAYRLTFLSKERIIVVPDNTAEDRYPAYREAFDKTSRVAYIHDNLRSRRSEEATLAWLRSESNHFSPQIEKLNVDSYTIFILNRTNSPSLSGHPTR